jgi:hypothetical protein
VTAVVTAHGHSVAAPVTHLGAAKMVHAIDAIRRVGHLATFRQRTTIAATRVEAMVHVAAKAVRPVKPRAGTDEESA